ncbi:hypothetical protein HQ865_16015 [Mucilaginibacter mali]|uniref:Lipoprotein n=1 Tax=Mucilaginibacter mali TaxID=2740462 RepID=A0A7D4TYA5_9SPHI|nr:hypothetical protein [Mucilaginibacter mali]QKJ31197.1 hypothetical protein HQ865_16015 [Mucilaginibacter mali]
MKPIKTLPVLLLLAAAGLFTNCKKSDKADPNHLVKVEATVYNSGVVAADGCDWTIKVGDVSYHPDNLGNDFKVDAQKVIIDAQIMDQKFICGWSAQLSYLRLNSIVKK